MTHDKKDFDKTQFEGLMANTFKPDRLIARDDKSRCHLSSPQDDLQAKAGAGGNATLSMGVFKTLKALSGDNDRIFVILDDREDIWI